MIQNNAQQLLQFDHTPRDFHGHPLDIMWMPWDVLDRYQDRRFMIEGNLIRHLHQLSRSHDVALDPSLGPYRAVGLLSSLLNWGGRLRPLPPMSPPQAQRFVDPDSSDSALF